jgi:ABC-type dipeptide/oligopeptide/nickel transport system permease component
MFAVRAGQMEEARAAFLQSLQYEADNANTYLWLAGVARTEREAFKYLDQARRLGAEHSRLARAAEGIHQHFSGQRPQPPPQSKPVPSVPQATSIALAPPRRGEGWGAAVAGALLSTGWRLLSVIVLLVVLVLAIAILMELGQGENSRPLGESLSAAADTAGLYFQGVSQGSLGEIPSRLGSSKTTPVVTALKRALPKSLGLLAVSMLIAVPLGIWLGIGAALRRHSRLSGLVIFASTFGISTPSFFAAMILIWLMVWIYQSTGKHLLPIAGFGWDTHLILPALVLAARPAAAVTRLSYNALLEILDAEYVRTATSKGLSRSTVLVRHVLRNAGVPILTTAIVSLRYSLAILPIVEVIFSWPGIGAALLTAIQAQNASAAIGLILPLALFFVLVNIGADILYKRLDPRLRDSKVGVA